MQPTVLKHVSPKRPPLSDIDRLNPGTSSFTLPKERVAS